MICSMSLETALNKFKKITSKKKNVKYIMGVSSLSLASIVLQIDVPKATADNQEIILTNIYDIPDNEENIYEEIDKLMSSDPLEKDQKKQQEDIYADPCAIYGDIYDDIGRVYKCEGDKIEENYYDYGLASNPYHYNKMTQTENDGVDPYYSQYCTLLKEMEITPEMKDIIYVKVQTYLIKQILPDWRKFARETDLPDVDTLLQHLDHDYSDDTQKMQEFFKFLYETFPDNCINSIVSVLYRMKKYASLQSIIKIIDEEKKKHDCMLPQPNEKKLTEKAYNADENNIFDILVSVYEGAAHISFLFDSFFKSQVSLKDDHKLLFERLGLTLTIIDGNSVSEQEKYFYESLFHANIKLHSLNVFKSFLTPDDENLIMKSSCNVRNVKFTVPVRIMGWSPKNKVERLTVELGSLFVEKDDFQTFFVPWIQLAEVLVLEIHSRTSFIHDLCDWIQSSNLKRYEIDYDQLKFMDVTDLLIHYMKKQELAVLNKGIKDEYSWVLNVCNEINYCCLVKLKGERVSIKCEKKYKNFVCEFNI